MLHIPFLEPFENGGSCTRLCCSYDHFCNLQFRSATHSNLLWRVVGLLFCFAPQPLYLFWLEYGLSGIIWPSIDPNHSFCKRDILNMIEICYGLVICTMISVFIFVTKDLSIVWTGNAQTTGQILTKALSCFSPNNVTMLTPSLYTYKQEFPCFFLYKISQFKLIVCT